VTPAFATLAILVASLVAFVRWLEPRFAFFPTRGETTNPAALGIAFESETIATADGEQLRAWRLHAPAPQALIVYFHGNGGNLSAWAPILSDIARHGYEVIAFDYRGYGLSTGRPSERGLYRDVDAIVAHASRARMPPRPLVFWGRSLGTAMAAYASTLVRPERLVLEAGFPDARSLVQSSPLALLALFSSYRFPTAQHANNGGAPTLVLHGSADSVIPFRLGRALYERLSGAKAFVEIAGGDHNDLRPAQEERYWHAIESFITR
jgi:fermentation-respiration switch protein FrsA (DUF1100 family)